MAAKHISKHELDRMIGEGQNILVDFWAPWCTHCRHINDAYDALADQHGGEMEIVKVNMDEDEALWEKAEVELIPTLRLYQGGKLLGQIVAPKSKAEIEAFMGPVIKQEKHREDETVHDMVIIGGGPGGYTAALYACRAGLDVLVVERMGPGGQMALTQQIDNYPGFAKGVDGLILGELMQQQAHRFGAKTLVADVEKLELSAEPKVLHTSEGKLLARTVVLATGANPRELGVAEEKDLVGRGVAYCAACDGMLYKGKTVVVVGGGNSAAADALLLSRIAKEVIVVHRRDSLRATKVYHEPLMQAENVHFSWNSVVKELQHDERITGVKVQDVKTGEERVIPCEGVFVSVGRKPATGLVQGQLELDAGGYIVAGEDTHTSISGVYAVGDVRTKQVRQVVTAVADGAVAVHAAEEYLAGQR